MPIPPHTLRRLVLVALLFSPLLAAADSFSDAGYAVFFLALLAAAAVPLLLLGLALLAFWFSSSKAWQTANAAGLAISVVAGVLWEVLLKQSSLTSSIPFNPFWQLSAPVAAWLGGMVQARADVRPRWRIAWVALAVVGARRLLGALQQLGFLALAAQQQIPSQLARQAAILQLLSVVLSFGVWVLLLRQAQQRQALNWQGSDHLAAPAVVATAGLGFTLVSYLLIPGMRDNLFTPALFGSLFLWAAIEFGIGTLAIWLDQQRRSVPG